MLLWKIRRWFHKCRWTRRSQTVYYCENVVYRIDEHYECSCGAKKNVSNSVHLNVGMLEIENNISKGNTHDTKKRFCFNCRNRDETMGYGSQIYCNLHLNYFQEDHCCSKHLPRIF